MFGGIAQIEKLETPRTVRPSARRANVCIETPEATTEFPGNLTHYTRSPHPDKPFYVRFSLITTTGTFPYVCHQSRADAVERQLTPGA